MDTVKKFIKYAIILIIGYVLINILTYGIVANTYYNVNDYQILAESPSITITESKATRINGYVVGKVTNNTDALIYNKYLRMNFYNQNGQYLGSNYVELSNFQSGKTLEFRTNYRYLKVASYTIDVTDQKVEKKESEVPWVYYEPDSSFARFMSVVGILMIIWYVL